MDVITAEVTERVVHLADDYADRLMASLSTASSEQELRAGMAGAFLCFLAEVLKV